MENKIPDILTLANKERFRRRLLVGSRLIAFLLIIAIFWIGFIQVRYVKEVNEIKAEYGSLGYCYLCGLETGRTCSCNYVSDLVLSSNDFSMSNYLENIATANVIKCENRNNKTNIVFS